MNTRDLEYVLALATTGQFGKAARRCGVSQPTLSTQVARLEADLGARLFERGPKGVTATPTGQRVLAQARRVLDATEALRAEADADATRWSGPLRLGVIPTAGPYLMPHVLPVIRSRQPEAQLFLREATTHDLLERLTGSDLDAAILSDPFDTSSVSRATIYDEPFVLATPRRHRWAKRRRLSIHDAADEPMILLEDGHCLRTQALRLCGNEAQPDAPFQASSLESLRQMVAAGIGPTLLPYLATIGPFADLCDFPLHPFTRPAPSRTLVLVWRRSYPRARLLEALARDMAGALDALPRPGGRLPKPRPGPTPK
ncbi:MAG: LysR substrate-binding domain-containing protein [Planctomycetota bacterium]